MAQVQQPPLLQQQPQQQQQQQQQVVQPGVGAPPTFVSTSLYVGDLDPIISEAQLFEIFNRIGPVLSIRVCRDLVTRRSLGYAYVNYGSSQDAARAMDLLNFMPVNGKPIRIMYSHRDPSIRKSGTANIFIKNLDKSIDHKALYDTFSAFGNILSCKVATDSSNQSKGYGFVQFDSEESAQNAIDKVNGMLLNDRQVFVGPFVRRQERDNAASKFNNVYVKNLAETTTDDDLKEVFGAFGPISSAVVMRDSDGKSKCFGFVNYDNPDDAAKAVDALNGQKFEDKEWYVGRAQKKSEREAELKAKFEQERKERIEKFQGANLYLKNLDDSVDDDKLREMFASYGHITSCKVMRDPQGQSRGSGFVAFSSPDAATRAVAEMNGQMVASKPIYVAMAQRKEERRAKLQAQFAQMRPPVAVASTLPNAMQPYHSGASGLSQQIFYSQPPPGLMPQQPAGYGYQQQMLAGIRPGGAPMQNFIFPVVQRPTQQGQRIGGRRNGVGPQQQPQQPMMRAGGRNMRYISERTVPDASVPPQGLMGAMLPVPLDGHLPAMVDSNIPISALSLASASPEQQRAMLGEQLYPLVDQLEHDHAGKVTGMLLEMDQTEVLHLIESPDALKSKVAEAMEVLRMAQSRVPVDQLASLKLSEPLAG